MRTFEAVEILESGHHNEEQQLAAWQHLIDTGTVWHLQGRFGRTAARLINQGVCKAPASWS